MSRYVLSCPEGLFGASWLPSTYINVSWHRIVHPTKAHRLESLSDYVREVSWLCWWRILLTLTSFWKTLPQFHLPSTISLLIFASNCSLSLLQWLQLAVTSLVAFSSLVGAADVAWNVSSCPSKCLCHLQLSEFPDQTLLKTVNCSFQRLKTVPEDIPRNTEALLLTNNELSDLYDHVPDLLHLRELDVRNNRIRSLGRGYNFHNLSNLTYFILMKNELTTLNRDTFYGLAHLEGLRLSENKISYIEDQAFHGLASLTILDLSRNQLVSLYPEWFYGLIKLKELYVFDNRVHSVASATFRPLRQLQHLSLMGNRISRISGDAFWGLDKLDTLHLERNNLDEVPTEALLQLSSLKYLYLSGNSFGRLRTGDIINLPVEELVLNSLPMITLVESWSFRNLTRLERLYMSDCPRLSYLDPQAFVNVTVLRTLVLKNNRLWTIPSEWVNTFSSGLEVDLRGNPILCDCNVRWIREEFELIEKNQSNVTFVYPDDVVCDMPEHIHGTSVRHLDVLNVFPTYCPPSIVPLLDRNVERHLGDSLMLDCRALGNPPPQLAWTLPDGQSLNNQQVSNSVRLKMKHSGSLFVYHLKEEDRGNYTCVAENSVGKAQMTVTVNVSRIDIHIFPTIISSNFVTLAWNGSARKILPQIKIFYRLVTSSSSVTSSSRETSKSNDFSGYQQLVVRTSRFDQTIGNLLPESTYEFCISFNVPDNFSIELSCTVVRTRDANYMHQGIHRTSSLTVAIILGVIVTLVLLTCFVTATVRKYRQRQYICPDKHIALRMSHIPLENLYSPLMSNAGP